MMRGEIRNEMYCLSENGRTTILHPDDVVSTTTGQTVFETLQDKHPEPTQPDDSIFSLPLQTNDLPYKQ